MAANNRLKDLLGNSSDDQGGTARAQDIELGEAKKGKKPKGNDGIQAYFKEVENIKADIAKIE